MSRITKEQAQSVSDLKAGYTLGHADVAMLNELARIALASLEAEPVAWLLSGGGAKNNVSFDSGNAYADPLREVTPLYTAHPAPVSVPAAMEMDDDFDSAFEHGKAVGWNAYRAAMLQSFGNSEQLNSPVIPDGWVACSERMPDIDTEIFYFCKDDGLRDCGIVSSSNFSDSGDAQLYVHAEGYDLRLGVDITHWMPLPAAPQQEVK
ncbi:DUF551 domain-containing protein [Escherichia coli]|uniref:DUF551 domain-containing protein n=1 Tax=Enterobacteriaceae TaxID=543 RepID=UPI001A139751|nr:DUF551 domain-containing protein [Escherichia coli]EGQ5285099.1 DUF551 domain-containing protein [Enterobacter hormaechei]HAV1616524.1 DUF551 domain-containing protein [Enterobacter hormaechei subsp. xiangfangensis]EKP8548519.1 DUF551 domain-containing protein [Escherichia coli]ELT9856172.1 DUF551 domain-containing protein [Escherichia coli]MEA3708992.1 DUF551 domain-containing protein [Enterobacter hormaechei]